MVWSTNDFTNEYKKAIRGLGGQLIHFESDGYFDIKPDYILEKIVVMPSATIQLRIGNGYGTEDIYPTQEITTDTEAIVINKYAKETKRIYVGGIDSPTDIIFIARKITTHNEEAFNY